MALMAGCTEGSGQVQMEKEADEDEGGGGMDSQGKRMKRMRTLQQEQQWRWKRGTDRGNVKETAKKYEPNFTEIHYEYLVRSKACELCETCGKANYTHLKHFPMKSRKKDQILSGDLAAKRRTWKCNQEWRKWSKRKRTVVIRKWREMSPPVQSASSFFLTARLTVTFSPLPFSLYFLSTIFLKKTFFQHVTRLTDSTLDFFLLIWDLIAAHLFSCCIQVFLHQAMQIDWNSFTV